MIRALLSVLTVVALSGASMGQAPAKPETKPSHQPSPALPARTPPPQPTPAPTQPTPGKIVQPSAGPPIAQALAAVGAEGKIELLDGLVDVIAINKSDLSAELREKMKPLIREWMLDVQQQAIDNIDFMEVLEPFDGSPGFFETFDAAQPKSQERISAFTKQLNAQGQLFATLEFRRVLDAATVLSLRQKVYQYDTAVLQQVNAGATDQLAGLKYQYSIPFRDSLGMFHRLLDRAAGKVDEAVAALKLTPEQAAAAAPAVAAVKAAKGAKETRAAVKRLLGTLPLAQKRGLLLKVRDLSPIQDPFAVP